jgi:oligopeptide/dipeptide ABC transporter ATP-binding protein
MTALAVSQLVDDTGRVEATRLELLGTDLRSGGPRAHRHLLGTSLAMVFQDPMTSFNPTRRMGGQLAEVARHHQGMDRKQALARAVDRLRAVRIPDAKNRAQQYPHEFSGGMRQRAMIGMGVMGNPALIVADEPTTALDVTVQQQVLDLLRSIREADDVALILISHDVTVVREVCDRVLVMYAGKIVEDLPAVGLTTRAKHPYTRALVAAVPDMGTDLNRPLAVLPGRPVDPSKVPTGCAYAPAARSPMRTAGRGATPRAHRRRQQGRLLARGRAPRARSLRRARGGRDAMSELRFDDVTVRYGGTRRPFTAVDAVSLTVPDGAVVGLVGSPGAASRHSPGQRSASRRSTAAGCSSAVSRYRYADAGARCRWCSRTRTPPSTPG